MDGTGNIPLLYHLIRGTVPLQYWNTGSTGSLESGSTEIMESGTCGMLESGSTRTLESGFTGLLESGSTGILKSSFGERNGTIFNDTVRYTTV